MSESQDFTAEIRSGSGETPMDVWDNDVHIEAKDIREALDKAMAQCEYPDQEVISIKRSFQGE